MSQSTRRNAPIALLTTALLLTACSSEGGTSGGAGDAGGAAIGQGGSSGTNGAAGTTGTAGASGAAGTSGTGGTSGAAGTTGGAGTTGAAGTTSGAGTTGAAGRGGASGAAGTMGGGGASGSTGAGGTSGAGGGGVCQKGQTKGNDVLLIGDSYIALSHGITTELEKDARASGSLAANEDYRDLSQSGTRMSGGGNPIPQQYMTGQKQSPFKNLVMCGTGNDMLAALRVGGCTPPGSSCALLTDALHAFQQLLQQVATDGTVKNIVYFYYHDVENNADLLAMEKWMKPQLKQMCDASSICRWLDLAPIFAGHVPAYIMSDGIHPTAAGSKAAADALWMFMQGICVAQ